MPRGEHERCRQLVAREAERRASDRTGDPVGDRPVHEDAEPDATAAGDPFLLQRALGNLARNAIDFAPAGSAIDLAAEAEGRVRIVPRAGCGACMSRPCSFT